MSLEIYDLIKQNILISTNTRRGKNSSGFINFNAVCCSHRGETQDRRQRGGIVFDDVNQRINYNCFNCKFKASFSANRQLNDNFKNLLEWFGFDNSDIKKIKFRCWQNSLNFKNVYSEPTPYLWNFEEKSLPKGSIAIRQSSLENKELLVTVNKFIKQKGSYFLNLPIDLYWSPQYSDRIIVPFVFDNKIVGWSARTVETNETRYIHEKPKNYMLGADQLFSDKNTVIIVEGVLDAISINGIAALGSTINEDQLRLLKKSGKKIILVPDRDRAGYNFVQIALDNDFWISLPPWSEKIKDVADACNYYGSIATTLSIMQHATDNKTKIEVIGKLKCK